jgi:hypothetical protein
MIICGTGCLGFASKWFTQIIDGGIVEDIDHLNFHAPNALNTIWGSFVNDLNVPADITTTVYHFGFSPASKTIQSYAYRSTNQFISEQIKYGIGIKPVCPIPDDFVFPRDIKKLMEHQREIESKKPKTEQIRIGGEILIHTLNSQGFNVITHDKFDDYEVDKSTIFKNYKDMQNTNKTLE